MVRMGKTNYCSLEQDAKLSEQVKKHPCLFDKNNDDYRNKSAKENAWSKVDRAREKPPGSSVHDWEVLLNRYSRKRMKIKSCNILGTVGDERARAEENLRKYKFLYWYNPYIRHKSTKLNVKEQTSPFNFSNAAVMLDDCSETLQIENGNESESSSSSSSQDKNRGSTINNQGSATTESSQKHEEVLGEILSLLKQKKHEPPPSHSNETADDIFGKLVTAELKTLPEEIRYVVKHEVSEVLYRYRGIALSTMNNKETTLNTSSTSFTQ